MIPVLARPSWTDIEKGCANIVHQILKQGIEIDYIVGLTRGGLIPAVVLSHILGIPVIPVSYSSTAGAGDNKNHSNIIPTIYGDSISGTGELSALPKLLIVDDICDSGHTMKEIAHYYSEQGHEVHTAALYWKETSVFLPDATWQLVLADDPWIIFPWES